MAERILVVDDDEPIRNLVEAVLEDEGYEVEHAESAEEALSKSGRWSLLITDYRMSGASGLALAGALKEEDPELPVILMTAHSDAATKREASQLGVRAFLAKPFDLDALVADVEGALRFRQDRTVNRRRAGSGDGSLEQAAGGGW